MSTKRGNGVHILGLESLHYADIRKMNHPMETLQTTHDKYVQSVPDYPDYCGYMCLCAAAKVACLTKGVTAAWSHTKALKVMSLQK